MLDWLPVAAAGFAVPQFLPQLARVRRAHDAAGVSWSWAALTSVSNGGWIAYFTLSAFWAALVPAASATVLAGALAVLLGRYGGVPRRPAAVTAAWGALLALAGAAGGRAWLGTALAASFVLQVAPSIGPPTALTCRPGSRRARGCSFWPSSCAGAPMACTSPILD